MPSLIRRLTVFAVLGALLAPAAAHARVPSDFIGITSDDVFAGTQDYRLSTLDAQRRSRIGIIRQTFSWAAIEASPGVYDLSDYDQYVGALAQKRMRVVPVLFNAPSFRTGHTQTRPAFPPSNNTDMANFAKVLVRRYGRSGSFWAAHPELPRLPITAWQIWNEPSLRLYWRNNPNAKSYVKMVKTVGAGIRSVDHHAEIVSAGIPPSKLPGAVNISKFIKQMYKARLGRYVSSLAINSYSANQKELSGLLTKVRRLMNRYGGRGDRLWITEIGWATSGPRSRFRVGSRGQAKLISRALKVIRQSRRRLKLRGFVYYSWRDQAPYPPNFSDMWGLHTGLLAGNGHAKKGLSAFRKAAKAFH